MNVRGSALSDSDYQALEARWIDRQTASRALLTRIDQLEACEILGRNGRAQYEGIGIPYVWPGTDHVREYAIRRDHPEIEGGKPRRKYMAPPGRGNMLYFPPEVTPEMLADPTLPLTITEGPFKALALYRLAQHELSEQQMLRFLPCALSGVWNFRGTIGKASDSNGTRIDEKGMIPDFGRIAVKGRKITIVFDIDWSTNESVRAALWTLTRELQKREAEVYWFDWPEKTAAGIKGIDDLLASIGPAPVLELLGKARYLQQRANDWRSVIVVTDKGAPRALLLNAEYAFRLAPEWQPVLGFDEFSLKTVARAETPWGYTGTWNDTQDLKAATWLQKHGIAVSSMVASQAIQLVASDHPYHPIRDYLDSLDWDGQPRLENWLSEYLGVERSAYSIAIGVKWLVSACARVYQPGCKADHLLILEGPQGALKSSALRVLGGRFFSDDVTDLGTKEAALQCRGYWIVELAELDAMSRAEITRIKAFITRQVDHVRPPYARHFIDAPRQFVFAGTVNESEYLRDASGARRFWPVVTGSINLESLELDRDHLWAEAAYLYKRGAQWWINPLSESEVHTQAHSEQEKRYEHDPWEQAVLDWIDGRSDTSIAEIIEKALNQPLGQSDERHRKRIGRVLHLAGWKPYTRRVSNGFVRRFRPSAANLLDS